MDGKIILKLMLEKQVLGVWNGLIWQPFVHDRKHLGSVKGRESVDYIVIRVIFK
jgi:hypothetical protein